MEDYGEAAKIIKRRKAISQVFIMKKTQSWMFDFDFGLDG